MTDQVETLTGIPNPYKVTLPHAQKDVYLKIATGETEWLAQRRFTRDLAELAIPKEKEAAWLELEQIALCIAKWPFTDKPHPTKFEDLLFLDQSDIQALKMSYAVTTNLDINALNMIANLTLGKTAEAVWQALLLAREIKMPFHDAMKLPVPERVLLVEAVMNFMSLEKEALDAEMERIKAGN